MTNVLLQAGADADRFLRQRTSTEANSLAHAMDAQRGVPFYLGEVVDLLRKAGAGAQFQNSVSPATAQCVRLHDLLNTARPAADSMQAARKDAPAVNLAQAGARDEVYGERYVYEVYRSDKAKLRTAVGQLSDDGARANVGRMLGAAERDGLIPGSEITSLPDKNSARAVPVEGMHNPDPLQREAEAAVIRPIEARRKELADAEAAVRKLDQELAAQLEEIGVLIVTDNDPNNADLQAYVNAFRVNHKYPQAVERVKVARAALAKDLSDHEADLVAHDNEAESVPGRRPARDIQLDGYMAIAGSDQPAIALAWTAAHRNDTRFKAHVARLDAIDQLACTTAIAQTIEHVRALYHASRAKPVDAMQQIHEYLVNVKNTYGNVKKLAELHQLPGLVLKFKAAYLAAQGSAGAIDAALEFIKLGASVRDRFSPISKLTGALGGMFTGMLKIGDIKDPAEALQLGKKFYDSLKTFHGMATGLATATPTQMQQAETFVKGVVKPDLLTVKNAFAVLGIAQGAIGFVGDLERLGDGGTAAEWTKTIADAAQVIGGILSLVPGPVGVVGQAIVIVANVVSMIAELAIAEEEKQKRRGDEAANLRTSKLFGADSRADSAATTMVTDNGLASAHAAADYGLSAPQIRDLAVKQRFLFETHAIPVLEQLRKILAGEVAIPHREYQPGRNARGWRLKDGLGKSLWEFAHLYDVARFQPIFQRVGATPRLDLGKDYVPAFPTGMIVSYEV